ncbi:hypothetical protein KKG41_04350 [Patescibacteria group bacterium]|nr:hypothetical protein [Patescibacteria group bacterium]
MTFVIDGRQFEAFVGILEPGETSVNVDEMLIRTDEGGSVVGEEDLRFITERLGQLPEELRRHDLVTKCPATEAEYPHHVYLLRWRNALGAWNKGWLDRNARMRWGASNIGSLRVLRRCA